MRHASTSRRVLAIGVCSATLSRASSVIRRGKYPLNIDWDPAPPPEEGAPFSVNALRDRRYLGAEIGGIVGAYLLIVASILLFVLVAGRRMRRALEAEAAKPKEIEMLAPHPSNALFFPSPVSPNSAVSGQKNFSWPSPDKNDRNPYIFPSSNVSPTSPASAFDIKKVEMDRNHLQQGLENLYAHVMEQEEAKASGVRVADLPPPSLPSASPQRGGNKRLEKAKPTPINLQAPEKSHSRASSLISSIRLPKLKGVRGMKISSPLATPMSSKFPAHYASDEEPLTPRHYHPPPPPPPIPSQHAPPPLSYNGHAAQHPYMQHSRNPSYANTDPSPVSPTRSIAEQMDTLQIRSPPNNARIATSRPPNLSIPLPPSRKPAPALAPAPEPLTSSASNSTRALPFRAFDPPPGLSSPSFSVGTKTTVLERTTPLSPGLRTPWSAGAVPYTPYQPFTPLMPVTPRLVTREERKRAKRKGLKSPTLEMVKDGEEMWDGGL